MAKKRRAAAAKPPPEMARTATAGAPPEPNGAAGAAAPPPPPRPAVASVQGGPGYPAARLDIHDFMRRAPRILDGPVSADQLPDEAEEWLWAGYIPRDQITLLVGPADCGKSTLLSALAAAVTTGSRRWGGSHLGPRCVLWYSGEEHLARKVRPRLRAAGADLSRVYLGDRLASGRQQRRLQLPGDLARLQQEVFESEIAMVVIDPITAYLGAGCDPSKDQPVRTLLSGLQAMAGEMRTTLLCTKHYKKGREGGPLDWIGGAAAWNQVPRAILALGADPDDPARRVIAPAKRQVGHDSPSLNFTIVDIGGSGVWTAGAVCRLTAEDLGMDALPPADRDALSDAEAYLREALTDEERPVKDVVRLGIESGLSLGTIRRAKVALGVTSHPIGPVGQRYWVWRFPTQFPPADAPPADGA